jgi:hypothetical protein
MRRLILASAVTAVLVMSMAAPAAAAPDKNPYAFYTEVTCGNETFVDTTTGKVGFLPDVMPGAIGIAFGGIRSLYTKEGDDLIVTYNFVPPPGLLAAGQLEACTAYVDWGDNYALWDPIWVMRTPNYPS